MRWLHLHVSLYLHQVQVIWFPNDDNSLEKVESLAFACNLGNWIPIAGFFYDWRYGGPRNTVLAASLLTLVGYGGLWLCSVHVPEGGYSSAGRLWLLRILWFMWGHGSGYFDCAHRHDRSQLCKGARHRDGCRQARCTASPALFSPSHTNASSQATRPPSSHSSGLAFPASAQSSRHLSASSTLRPQ